MMNKEAILGILHASHLSESFKSFQPLSLLHVPRHVGGCGRSYLVASR